MIKRLVTGLSGQQKAAGEKRAARVLLGLGALAATMLLGARDAHAGVYVQWDYFNTLPTDWSLTTTSSDSAAGVASWAGARSASNVGYIVMGSTTTTSDWAGFDKTFFEPGSGPPFSMTFNTPTACAAGVYLDPVGGAKGAIQMINAFDDTYIGSTSFNLSASSSWVLVSVNNTYACSPWIDVRILLDGGAAKSTYLDDVQVQWQY
jgi:hypothetical protein